MTIERATNGAVRLARPAEASDFILQWAPNVTGLWSNATTPPTLESNRLAVYEPISGAAKFYRLMAEGTHRLIVASGSPHFVVKDDASKTPFFWLADTGWTLFQKTPTEVNAYLANRANKGFNVIQIMLTRFGGTTANYRGDLPFSNLNPVVLNGPYWQHIDYIVNKAEEHGIYLALFSMWGSDVDTMFPNPATNNYQYGNAIAQRYQDQKHIVWSVCGEYEKINDNWRNDTTITEAQKSLIRALADGIRDGQTGNSLMTIHPITTSSQDFHNDAWLDFNMRQTWGHIAQDITGIGSDYNKTPGKPVLNAEPGYENRSQGDAPAWHLRLEGYWSVFSGAFGYTYGAEPVWQFTAGWEAALDYPGAFQMKHLRALMESRPMLERVPDQTVIASAYGSTAKSNPTYRVATRASNGAYAFVYSTQGDNFDVNMAKISGGTAAAWWYNPRNGKTYDGAGNLTSSPFGSFAASGTRTFNPPGSPGLDNDWVLVLDDATRGYGALAGRLKPPDPQTHSSP